MQGMARLLSSSLGSPSRSQSRSYDRSRSRRRKGRRSRRGNNSIREQEVSRSVSRELLRTEEERLPEMVVRDVPQLIKAWQDFLVDLILGAQAGGTSEAS